MASVSAPANIQFMRTPQAQLIMKQQDALIPIGKINYTHYSQNEGTYKLFLDTAGGMGCLGKRTCFHISCSGFDQLVALYKQIVQNSEHSASIIYDSCNVLGPAPLETGDYISYIDISFKSPDDCALFTQAFLLPLVDIGQIITSDLQIRIKLVEKTAEKVSQSVKAIFATLNQKASEFYKLKIKQPVEENSYGCVVRAEEGEDRREPIICGALLIKNDPFYHLENDRWVINHAYAEKKAIEIPTDRKIEELRTNIQLLLEKEGSREDLIPQVQLLHERMGVFENMSPIDFEIMMNLYHSVIQLSTK